MTKYTSTPELADLEKQRAEAWEKSQANPGDFALLTKWVQIDNLVNRKGREHVAALKASKVR